MSVTLNGTSGLVFGDGTIQGTAAGTGFRNRLINGAFDIWQRGTARSFLTGAGGFLADRWSGGAGFQQGGHQRVAISSPPAGLRSNYAIRCSSSTTGESAGGTRISLSQKIENLNCYDLAGQTVTLSFWVRFSAATATSSTGTAYTNWIVRLQQNTTTTDSAFVSDTGDSNATVTAVTGGVYNGGTNAGFTNGSLPTTWTKVTVTSTLAAALKNVSVRMEFNGLGSTAAADTVWYEVAEVQLERGSAPTDFERRQIQTEISMCQRYYESITTPSGSIAAAGQAIGPGNAIFAIRFCVNKRSNPTFSSSGPWIALTSNGSSAGGTVGLANTSSEVARLDISGATGLVAGNSTVLFSNGGTGFLNFISEL